MSTEITHHMVETNGVRLHTACAGPENGPPVILFHGFPEFWAGWKRQIPVLAAAGYRVIAPDQRGYNLSSKPPTVSDYRPDNLVQDIFGLADALGYDDFYLVGHDWGAAVAWWMVTRLPDRIRKLAILNLPYPSILGRSLRGGNWRQLLRSWYIFFFQLPRLLAEVDSSRPVPV